MNGPATSVSLYHPETAGVCGLLLGLGQQRRVPQRERSHCRGQGRVLGMSRQGSLLDARGQTAFHRLCESLPCLRVLSSTTKMVRLNSIICDGVKSHRRAMSTLSTTERSGGER